MKTHLLHIYAQLGVNDRAAAVGAAFERGCSPRVRAAVVPQTRLSRLAGLIQGPSGGPALREATTQRVHVTDDLPLVLDLMLE